jgi:hypothetical protein
MTGNSIIYTATVYKILFGHSHQTECDEWATQLEKRVSH